MRAESTERFYYVGVNYAVLSVPFHSDLGAGTSCTRPLARDNCMDGELAKGIWSSLGPRG